MEHGRRMFPPKLPIATLKFFVAVLCCIFLFFFVFKRNFSFLEQFILVLHVFFFIFFFTLFHVIFFFLCYKCFRAPQNDNFSQQSFNNCFCFCFTREKSKDVWKGTVRSKIILLYFWWRNLLGNSIIIISYIHC